MSRRNAMEKAPKPVSDPVQAGVAARRRWMAVLARTPARQLEQALARDLVGPLPGLHWLRPPETGLVMVRGRMDGVGRRFNLGEMTMTRCAVRTDDGHTGFAFVAGRDARQAELAALLDALLQDEARRAKLMETVVEPLARAQEEQRREARRKTRATKVDFFTMVRGED